MHVVDGPVGVVVRLSVGGAVDILVGVMVEVGVGVVVGVGVGVLVGVGVCLEHSVVADARSALVLAREESTRRTVVSRSLWAAVIGAVEPEPECDEPEDLVVPVALPVPVPLPVLLLAVLVVLPVPVALVLLLVVPVVLVLLLVVPVVLPMPDAVETWPDSAWARVSSALATCSWVVARAYFREVVSKVARTWPAVTLSPMATGTLATIPDTAKDTVAALEGSVVPVACSACVTGCEPTLAVTYVGAVPLEVA